MQIFIFIVFISAALWYMRNILFWVGLWQDKEYRRDRLFVHFKETVQGRKIFFSPVNVFKWILFFSYGVVIFNDKFSNLYDFLLGVFFIIQGVFVLQEAFLHHTKRPVFTVKAIVLSILTAVVIGILVSFPVINGFVWLLFIDRILALLVAIFVFFFAFPTEIFTDIQIQKATQKLKSHKKILIIAVSGSYGKTSTKEYIAQVLSAKFSVSKTPLSNNTPIGIAKAILNNIYDDTEIFVAEVGAYKRGEIAELAYIIKPVISVTTAISDQHISLYGSLQNVIDSEYELIHALPKNGLALFNGNSSNTDTLYARTKIKKILYRFFPRKPKQHMEICAYNVQAATDGISFTTRLEDEEFICKASLYGVHTVENILPAIFLAHYMGFSKEEIIKAIARLQPPPQTMIKKILSNGTIVMDDTFNASPESVLAAMDYIMLYKKKKIFVLPPLTELGQEAKNRHYQIGKRASTTCDYIFLLNKNFSEAVIRGILDGKGNCEFQIARPEKIADTINQIAKKGDVIVFEGKEAKMVLKKIL